MTGNNQYVNSWINKEEQILKDYYRYLSNYELVPYLNDRTPGAVKRKLVRMGLKRDKESLKYIRSRITSGENNGMYGRKRPQWLKDKLRNLRIGKKLSKEHKEKIGNTGRIMYIMGKRKVNKSNVGKKLSKSHREKISNSLKGRIKSKGEILSHSFSLRESFKEGKIIPVWLGKKCPWVTKRNLDPEFQKKCRLAQNIKPNKPEKIVINLIQQNNLNFVYVGDGKIWFKGTNHSFNPDFLSKNPKYIIEVFGDYWHNLPNMKKRDKERLETYSKYGYKTLIIWEYELKNSTSIINKIKDLIKK